MTIRGWCPSLAEPMRSGDGWIVRIKPRRRGLAAAQARTLAAEARRWGAGWIGLTNRANLQVRGLGEAALEPFAAAMLRAGLAEADPAMERQRNLLGPPLLGSDPALDGRLDGLLDGLEAVLGDRSAGALPGKFGLVVEGGGALPLGTVAGDLHLRAAGDAVWLQPDGACRALRCRWDEAAEVASRLIGLFLARRGGTRRMRGLVLELGEDGFWAAAGMVAEMPPAPSLSAPAAGFGDCAGSTRGFIAIGLALGRLDPDMLDQMAVLAERFGDGSLRVTPWRLLLLPGVARDDAPELLRLLAAAGGITEPDDPRLRLLACPGAPHCASATVDTAAAAARLLALGAVPKRGLLHLSACGKGCAHPGMAEAVLVGGADGRYGLVRGGTARDLPEAVGLTVEQAASRLRATEDAEGHRTA